MYKNIIISSCLFGSLYIFSKSLELINKSYIQDKKSTNLLIAINGLTFIVSGSIFICSFYQLAFKLK